MNEQLARARGALEVRDARLVWGARTYLMGIVNASPDSFSGDGVADAATAAERGLALIRDGADVIDVGAESTRPGHVPLSAATERERLLPAVQRLRERAPHALISVDTFKPGLFREAHACGADILNSIWGIDEAMLQVVLECEVPIVAMHNKRVAAYENDVVDEVLSVLESHALRAVKAGIPAHRIILDPGIGFGKTAEHNIAVLRALDRLVGLGFPTLIGTSRKSTIGRLTGRRAGERAFGTAATVALAAAAGVDMVRVHDVAAMRDAVRVSDAIARGWRPDDWNEG